MLRSAFVLGMITIMPKRPVVVPVEAPVRIAVLGDSLAFGTGASSAAGGFIFPAFRALLVRRPGSRLDNVAIGGATVADVVRLQAGRLAGVRYDVVIVCVGGNDVVRGTPAVTFRRTYTELLRRIAAATPGARVICCGVPDVSVSPIFASERDLVRETAMRDDAVVRALAAAHGAAFVDVFGVSHATRDPERFLGHDRFHPSDAGYVLLANALTPVLNRVIERRQR